MPYRTVSRIEPLLIDVLSAGKPLRDTPSLEDIRTVRQADVAGLEKEVRSLIGPKEYHVSVSQRAFSAATAVFCARSLPPGLTRFLDQAP